MGFDKYWDRGGRWVGGFFFGGSLHLSRPLCCLLFLLLLLVAVATDISYGKVVGAILTTVAVTPDGAAKSLAGWIETSGVNKTGQY